MSLIPDLSSNKSKAFESRLHRMLVAVGRRRIDVVEAIAEARMQRAMIEAKMYCNRSKHSSKNDDDLPAFR